MNLTIELKISGQTSIDISSGVDINSVSIQNRSDFSFECGSFVFHTKNQYLQENIAPYSLCKITDEHNQTRYYFITSEATKNIVNSKVIHTCKLYSLLAKLETFILGTKGFKNNGMFTNDAVIVDSVIDLLDIKYGGIGYTRYSSVNVLKAHEYYFGSGTTLFEVVRAVASKNNVYLSVELENSWDSFSLENIRYKIYFKTLAELGANTHTITTSNENLMNIRYYQNNDNYCKYLETEANNVIDRDNTTVFKNLFCKSKDGIGINSDNAVVEFPVKAEGVTKFEVYGNFIPTTFNVILSCFTSSNYSTLKAMDDVIEEDSYILYCTYTDLVNTAVTHGTINNVFNYFYQTYLKPRNISISQLDSIGLKLTYYGLSNARIELNQYNPSLKTKVDYTSIFFEEDEWNGLTTAQQACSVMHPKNSNQIVNLNARYKDDLWNIVLGFSSRNFLYEYSPELEKLKIDNSNYIEMQFATNNDYDPLHYTYYVTAKTITNPKLTDTKNLSVMNEASFKETSRSYQQGDSNGLPIYFDALVNDIDKQNDTLGLIELSMDLRIPRNITNFTIPKPNDQVNFNNGTHNGTFYVFTTDEKYTSVEHYITLYLAQSRYKISDAIGVDYQFNATRFDLDTVIERPIELTLVNSNAYDDAIDTIDNEANQNTLMLWLVFKDNNDTILGNYVKQCAILLEGTRALLFTEMIDNVIFDYQTVDTSDLNKFKQEAKIYTDSNGEAYQIDAYLLVVDLFDMTASKALPMYSAIYSKILSQYQIVSDKKIYKDVSEKLTFTINVKNQ